MAYFVSFGSLKSKIRPKLKNRAHQIGGTWDKVRTESGSDRVLFIDVTGIFCALEQRNTEQILKAAA